MTLIERQQQLADLAAWRAAAARQGGSIVLVGGEAGIGKTSLLGQFAALQPAGARVLWGACDALFTPQPLAPLHDIARQVQGPLAAALVSGAPRDMIFSAALDELERGDTIAVFEDMHWADEATLDLVRYLGRRIGRTRALLLISYRDDEVGPQHPLRLVSGELPRAQVHRMTLPPLSAAAVEQLARAAGHAPAGLHHLTGGNPLFVTEVLSEPSGSIPATVRDGVLARAARLDAASRAVAEFASVVPGRTEGWLLQSALAPPDAAIDGCRAIGLQRGTDGSVAFRHELVRRALEDTLSVARRRELHAAVLRALGARPGIPAARLAHHAGAAGSLDDILRHAPEAATQAAQVGAHREAIAHLQIALDHAAGLPATERARLQERLAYECYLTGQHERGIEARFAALQTWRAQGLRLKEGDALRGLSRLSWFAGLRPDANRYAIDAVTVLEALEPGPELAMAYTNRADLDLESHDAGSSIDWARRAIAIAERLGYPEILSHALNTLGTMRLIVGDAGGFADIERSLVIARAGGIQEQVARGYTALSAMSVSRRLYAEAQRHLDEGMAYCEARNLDAWWLYMLMYRARMRLERGEWNAASLDAERVLGHPLATPITCIPALRILGTLRIRRGDPDARSPLDEARALGGPVPEMQRIGTLAAAEAEAAWLADDLDAVVRLVRPAYEMVCDRQDPRMKGELAAWLWRAGAYGEPPAEMAEVYALEISGDWRRAASEWRTYGCPYELACVLGWYGGEEEQREALALLDGLGAAPAARALRRRMRERGVRGVARGARASTRDHRYGLTGRESEVLGLLTEGLSNAAIAGRLCLSTRTVDRHVSAILAKLGVPSRARAIAMAREQALSGP